MECTKIAQSCTQLVKLNQTTNKLIQDALLPLFVSFIYSSSSLAPFTKDIWPPLRLSDPAGIRPRWRATACICGASVWLVNPSSCHVCSFRRVCLSSTCYCTMFLHQRLSVSIPVWPARCEVSAKVDAFSFSIATVTASPHPFRL